MRRIFHAVLVSLCLLGNCSLLYAADGEVDFLDDAFYEEAPEENAVRDPFEGINRVVFTFNDYAFIWVLNPLANGYSKLLPSDIRGAIANVFYNLQEPMRFINSLLQVRFSDAGTLLTRFTVNTIGGVGGLGDPASELGFEKTEATFCQTLDNWGVPDGIFLMVPVMGPTTLRDISGRVVDRFSLSPIYYNWAAGWEESVGIYMGKEVNNLSLHLGEYEAMKKMSFDPYIAVRDGFYQLRRQRWQNSMSSSDAVVEPLE
ncbi:MAG: VacJ family lipoprotein [Candidatus Electrothrix aestuarii]|jgi:phospholipid-binding lipoprotein MlaA|uniref:VacJ family lipoprotein n=1 Tax=Candidatus Electrothrix aestuarii TaxID=3062594 RepID=A0AAU8LTU6_9BACT|nr:VacJ family lipoprotein [Candidatus Electrothrix aestuarii]